MEQFMRSTPLILAVLGTLAASGSAAVNAQSIGVSATTVPGQAPIGHLQPRRGQQFAPGSPAEQAVQDKQSSFDAQQQKADEELDQHLNICRGC
jgi:hypothetical protein